MNAANNKSIIIVGSFFGAWQAAKYARRFNEDAEIVVIGEGHSPPLKNIDRANNIIVRNARAVSLDPDASSVTIVENSKQLRLRYDAMIFLGKVQSVDLSIEGLDSTNIVSFLDAANVFNQAKRALVVGADLAGIETALLLRKKGLLVTLIDKHKRVLKSFSLAISHAVIARLSAESINVILDDHPERGFKRADGLEIISKCERKIHTDVVINAEGLCPQISLLADAGCALDVDGFVRVDDKLLTTLPNVYACSPAIKLPVVRSFERKWLYSQAIIKKTAFIAGKNAVSNEKVELSAIAETNIVTVGHTDFARTGLSEEEARKFFGVENITAITVYEEPSSFVRLLFETKQQQIIGAEIFGDFDVAGHITMLSHAVRDAFTPDRLLDIDIFFKSQHPYEPLREAAERAHYHFAQTIPMISVDTLALWLKKNRDFLLIDVGDTPYFRTQHVKQMAHVPLARLCEKELPIKESPIVLYSSSSEQSQMAESALRKRGFKNVYNLDGGVLAFSMLFAEEQ